MLFIFGRTNALKWKPFTQSPLSLVYPSFFHALSSAVASTSTDENSIKPLTRSQLKTLVLSQYKQGRFSNIIRNVIASPAVLLSACQNLAAPSHFQDEVGSDSDLPCQISASSISIPFDLFDLAGQLAQNNFDPGLCCLRFLPSSGYRCRSLVLPDLKLKVVVEAIRMVLEVMYDDGFRTFVYGGRPGMGRHTAVRYLKNSIENPSWWFVVAFNRAPFDSSHVERLCSMMQERIDDELLTGLIGRLYEVGAVKIDLGGCYLGKGFPEESGLCSTLLNIYLDGFDRKLQKIRLCLNEENNKVDSTEHNVFHKPVKVYAVRYLDELLVATSGSKVFTMDLKNWVSKYLEEKLDLKVDRTRTVIHSAVSEKISFLGMELQAVPPSVLRPPMSEKAVRALKKRIRQREVRALELKNARERNRKKLGLKILMHVFKKLKQSNGFNFEYQIKDEVRQIFRTWADEIVEEFLGSVDERWQWHRHLTAGNFFKLEKIRNQLPQELVDAYDKFQDQVEKHLSPVKAQKSLEEKERRAEEEEERKYSERTVADLTKLSMKVDAPIELVRKAVKLAGFTNKMGRPRPISLLVALEDADIIKWYAGIGRRWLDYYCCCHNFKMVKTVVTYHMRFSCLLTLAEKHESTKREAIKHYTKDLKVVDLDGKEEIVFPTEREIKSMGVKHLSDPLPVDGVLCMALVRLAYDENVYTCSADFCSRKDTIVYRIHLLPDRLNVNPLDEYQWVAGMGCIHDSLGKKCLPLCGHHISQLYLGRISLQDIDWSAFVNVD